MTTQKMLEASIGQMAQRALLKRARLNGAAQRGEYHADMESEGE